MRQVLRGENGSAGRFPKREVDFEKFMKFHEREVLRYICRLIRNYHTAEDLRQETFLRAYRAFSRGDSPPEPRPWLFRVAKHLVIDHCRKKEIPSTDLDFLGEVAEAREIPDPPPSLVVDGTKVSQSYLVRELSQEILNLSPNCRKILSSHYREGRRCWEIAVRNGFSTESAKVRLFRGRQKLRKLLVSRIHDPQFSYQETVGKGEGR